MLRRIKVQISHIERLNCCLNRSYAFAASSSSSGALSGGVDDDGGDGELYSDVPRPPRRKAERKPFVTPMKELIRRAREEREARKLQPCLMLEKPPENGLLVPELVEVAHRVYRARGSLLKGLSELLKVVPVQRCRWSVA
ncbi:hypothetical protein EUGRSUZ_D00977 [Eucalyptus grandis]|uniref:Uncharacterized protein n=2 Tax=Eucalyptus grandis TaxID=71139 RepID=A0ACC3L558_EUCGR|nr:hypothetical protein EUGRSUZ_D00977 [Eucalyptus grandis]